MRPTFLHKAIYDDIFTKDRNFYRQTVERTDYPQLDKNHQTDVLIIGGGVSGLATAYYLGEKSSLDITVVERHFLGWGASGRNGGQILPGYMNPPGRMVRKFGFDVPRKLWDISIDGVEAIKNLIDKHEIDCDLSRGAITPVAPKYYDRAAIEKKTDLLNSLGVHAKILDRDETAAALSSDPEYYAAAIANPDHAYHFHPLKYVQGLGRAMRSRVNIFENSGVIGINPEADGIDVYTAKGVIRTRKLILCGDSYLGTLVPSLRRKYVLIRNGMVATEILPDGLDIMKADYCASEYGGELFFYKKTFDNRLIVGGGDAVRPNSNFLSSEQLIIDSLKKGAVQIFPALKDIKIDYIWGGYIGVTSSYMPYIGNLADNVYYMGGYSGHGVNLTHAMGMLMADAVINKRNGTGTALDKIRPFPLPGQGDYDVILARLGMFIESVRERFD